MSTSKQVKPALIIISIFFITNVSAQTRYEGDQLAGVLGKTAESTEFTTLLSNYQLQMANETHYLSTEGIELLLAAGVLKEVQLYRNSAVYGQFTGSLPRGLRFGMTSKDVRAILGRPTVVYNSNGYLEFESGRYVYACSFEDGQLNRLSVSLK